MVVGWYRWLSAGGGDGGQLVEVVLAGGCGGGDVGGWFLKEGICNV